MWGDLWLRWIDGAGLVSQAEGGPQHKTSEQNNHREQRLPQAQRLLTALLWVHVSHVEQKPLVNDTVG